MSVIKGKPKKMLNLFLISAICGIIVSTAPQAFAAPGIGTSEDPGVPALGGIVRLKAVATADAPMTDLHIRVYEPGLSSAGVLPPETFDGDGICNLANPDTSLRVWDLRRATTPSTAGYALFDLAADGDFFEARFGDGSPAELTFSAGGSAQGSGAFFWYDINGGGAGTDVIDVLVSFSAISTDPRYRYVVCGFETTTTPGDTYTDQRDSFFTQKPVAGEILPIDTTALLIAGVSANSSMVLAGLVVVAGSSFALIRFITLRK